MSLEEEEKKQITCLSNKINNKDKTVIIFGIRDCIYCKKALEFLREKNISYKFYNIINYKDTFFIIFKKLADYKTDYLINKNHESVPVIFVNNKFIGGSTDLINFKFNN